MDKAKYNFRDLSLQILTQTSQGFCEEYFAVGNTKILLRNEVVSVLEFAKKKARKVRDKAAKRVKRTFGMFLGRVEVEGRKLKMVGI